MLLTWMFSNVPALSMDAAPSAPQALEVKESATAATTATAAPALLSIPPASLPTSLSRDNQIALEALQQLSPAGWNVSSVRIFLPGIDTVDSNTPGDSHTESTGAVESRGGAPQFFPFNQLGLEVEAQRVAILREFHCVSVYSKTFKRGQRQIFARIYFFNAPASAYGAYSLLHQGASTVIRRGDGSSEDDQGISFWQGRTFVSVYGTSLDDDESKEVARSIADRFSNLLQEHASLPAILDQLPRLDRVRGSERIVMGSLSARHFFPAPYLNFLDFSHVSEAATVDYKIQTPPDRLKLLYIDYLYPAYALAAYNTYTQNFSGKAVNVEEPIAGASCMYKVNGTFILCQQMGGRLAIITGARKKESAALLARYLH